MLRDATFSRDSALLLTQGRQQRDASGGADVGDGRYAPLLWQQHPVANQVRLSVHALIFGSICFC